jgi:hypothetical protein
MGIIFLISEQYSSSLSPGIWAWHSTRISVNVESAVSQIHSSFEENKKEPFKIYSDVSLLLWTLCFFLVNLFNNLNCTCIYVLYDFWFIPHPVVIWLTYGSMECNIYVCMYSSLHFCRLSTSTNGSPTFPPRQNQNHILLVISLLLSFLPWIFLQTDNINISPNSGVPRQALSVTLDIMKRFLHCIELLTQHTKTVKYV